MLSQVKFPPRLDAGMNLYLPLLCSPPLARCLLLRACLTFSAPFEPRGSDANFVVASASVGSVSLSLLEHQEQQAGRGVETKEREECAAEDEEPESISVPVHGLGTVNVLSAPVSAR